MTNPRHRRGFFVWGVGLDKSRCSTNATKGAFGPPQQSEGARRVQSPEAMAIEDNPPGPTKFLSLCFYSILFFQNRAFWRVSVCGRYRQKVVIDVARNLNTSIRYQAFAEGTYPLKRNDALTPPIYVLLSASKPKVLHPHLCEDSPLRPRTLRRSCSADQKPKT